MPLFSTLSFHSLSRLIRSSGFYGAREDNRGRLTDSKAGRHPNRTNQWPTSIIPPIIMPDALPTATLPIYPGLGQAPNMLDCIPSGLFMTVLET